MKKLISILFLSLSLVFAGCGPDNRYDHPLIWETLEAKFPDSEITQDSYGASFYIKKPDGSVWLVEFNTREEIRTRRKIFD